MTIEVVDPRTPAAKAGLQPGDVLLEIDDVKITTAAAGHDLSRRERASGASRSTLQVRRGVPHPYSSHPRLDLFVGSLSPHKAQDIGCTICHEGQGSATAFKWASHTPNTPAEADEWRTQARLVRQPSLDLPDAPAAVRREQLPEVPSRSRRSWSPASASPSRRPRS